MDPLSALLLAGVLSALVTRTAGSAVTDAIAQSRGKTPPSLEKWRARQAQRSARGERAQADPGPWRRRWRNEVEARNARAAQKHQARLDHIRDQGPDMVAKHKQRLQKRADRRDAIGTRVAGWGKTSWSAAKQTAERAAEPARERRAWRENARRDARASQDTDTTTADDLDTDTGADVLPFPDRRQSTEDGDVVHDSDRFALASPERQIVPDDRQHPTPADTDQDGDPTMTHAPTTTEITDLDTAIMFSAETAKYTDTVSATLADITAQLAAAVQGLQAESGAYEGAEGNLIGAGFGSQITGLFGAGQAALNDAAEAVKQALDQVSAAADQVDTAGGEMRDANRVFGDQISVAESIGAARQYAGVARDTSFY